jgi:hypothetical protein
VDGITGREDQKRDEERIAELLVEVQRLTALVRTVDLFGTGFVWTDRATGKQHMLHPADVAVILRADQGTEIEKIKESAYRAGREDAARDLRTAVRLIGTECENFRSGTCVDSGRTPDARYTADRWCDHCILREALAGPGVQPTEEQRADEDQKRDEE